MNTIPRLTKIIPWAVGIWMGLAVLSACTAASSEPEPVGDFAIYLVEQGAFDQQFFTIRRSDD